MSALNFILYKNKPLKNKEFAVRLRIYNRTIQDYHYISIGVSCKPKEWDEDSNRFNSLKTSYRSLNKMLDSKEESALNIWSQMEPFDLERFKRKWLFNGEETLTAFFEFLRPKLGVGNAKKYAQVLPVLEAFKKDLTFKQITKQFLKDFESYLLHERTSHGNPLKNTTIRFYFATIASLFNKAIEYEWIEMKYYPFKNQMNPLGFAYSKYKTKVPKPRAVTKDVLKEIYALSIDPEYSDAVNYFVFSYLARGMSFCDLASLKKSQIINNRFSYTRRKSRREVTSILLTDTMQEIMGKYKTHGKYVFPIITKTSEEEIYEEITRARNRFNRKLKAIGTKLGTEIKLTSYVSRYTFANVTIDSGADIRELKELMGHSEISTTEIYVRSVEKSKLDKYQNLL